MATALLFGISLSACGDKDDTADSEPAVEPAGEPEYGVGETGIVDTGVFAPEYGVEMIDQDEDGWFLDIDDCDDQDPNTHPTAAENEENSEACMTDADGDGYGSATPNSGVTAGTDCNDADATIHPAATETAGDGIDSNCNSDDDN